MNKHCWPLAAAAGVLLVSAAPSPPAGGQDHAGHGQAAPAPGAAPARITMEALHAAGGVPPGWRFTLPPGDAAAGRQAFVDLKCYACHALQGEQFPLKPGEAATAGPDLTGMGQHHPTEYLVESIVNPSAVLVEGPGYVGGDGRSIMPATPEMTVAQLVDLVAYLKSRGAGAAHEEHAGEREQTAGGYRVRLVYRTSAPPGEDAHHHDAAMAPGSSMGAGMAMGTSSSSAGGTGKSRLLAFVFDAASGQPIPYLPVTARLEGRKAAVKTVKLAPVVGAEGFYYGADVTIPETTTRVTLSIGRAGLALRPGAPAQLARSQRVGFDWK